MKTYSRIIERKWNLPINKWYLFSNIKNKLKIEIMNGLDRIKISLVFPSSLRFSICS